MKKTSVTAFKNPTEHAFAVSKTNILKAKQGRIHIVHFPLNTRQILCRKAGRYYNYGTDLLDKALICEDCLTLAGEH